MRVTSGARSQAYSASVVGLVSNCASACPRPCIGSKAVKMSHLGSEVCSPITHRRAGDRAQRSESTLLRGVVNTNLCVPPVIGILISRTGVEEPLSFGIDR
jgi:hypothetical protein